MRFQPRRSGTGHLLAFDITPMIDIVFLLIIFFMTTAQFARMTRAELELPKEPGEQEQSPDEAGLIINLDAAGRIFVNVDDGAISLAALEQRVADAIVRDAAGDPHQFKLMIRADRRTDTARLNAVLEMLETQGVSLARIATEVP